MDSVSDYVVLYNLPTIAGESNICLLTVLKPITYTKEGAVLEPGGYIVGLKDLCIYACEQTGENELDIQTFRGNPVMKGNKKLLLAELVWGIGAYTEGTTFKVKEAINKYCDATNGNKNLLEIMPTSPALFLTNQAINAISANRNIKPNKNTTIEWQTQGDVWAVTSKNKKNTVTITHNDVSILRGKSNKGLSKLLAFTMQQANAQNYNRQIFFPLQALVDYGMYSNLSSARKGFKDNIIKLMGFIFQGETVKGKKTILESGRTLFSGYDIENNYVTVYLNDNFNIEFLAQYYTMLPSYSYALKSNSFSLIQYIFFLARQNANSIKEKGTFNIGLEAIRAYLCLPTPEETQNHSYLIKEPIEKAIEEIENANNSLDFTITPYYNYDYSNIREWLAGYLQIGLKGEYAKHFISIASGTQQKIEQAKKRQEKAMQKALEAKYAKSLEASATPLK